MLKQFPITELIKAIQAQVAAGTGMKCLDFVKKDEPSPFYYVVFNKNEPVNSKTMFMSDYVVYIHVVAEPDDSSVPVYKYIQELEEALTTDITIPDPYILVMQTDNGVQTIYTDETNEKHAVLQFTFRVAYGWKCKL